MTLEKALDMHRLMLLARKFDEAVIDLYASGEIPGFMHLYIGEEAVAVGACAALGEKDFITSTPTPSWTRSWNRTGDRSSSARMSRCWEAPSP